MSQNTRAISKEVTISFLGDFCPINRVEELIVKGDFSAFENIRKILADSDLVVANLECPLTNYKKGIKKSGPNLKGLPESVKLMKFLNISVAALANNHILDYGQPGLSDTLLELDENGISHLGAGLNQAEAQKPFLRVINGLRICILNACEKEFNIASRQSPGANPFEITSILDDIEINRPKCDYLILFYHGGIESYNLPTPEMQEKLSFLAKKGVDLIICNHQHVFSGFRKIGKSIVFYGLGNFIFDWPSVRNAPWNYGLILKLILREDKSIDFDLIPYEQCNHLPSVIINDKLTSEKMSEVEKLNMKLDEVTVRKEWDRFVNVKEAEILSDLVFQNRYFRYFFKRTGMYKFLISKDHKRRLYNYFNCVSLSEIARDVLKTRVEY